MTRCPALRVDRRRGEEIRQRLVESGRLRTDLTISREDEHLLFPLIDSDPLDPSWGERVDGEFEPLEKSPNMSYRDLLHWPEAEEALLPRSFDVIGDIVLVRIPLALRGRASEIGEALRQFVPGTRLVGADFGVHGEARQRRLVVIAGAGGWRTLHRENGIEMEVDLRGAYFSPRLAREHARVAASIRTGDRVFDLCCGVGPFALTIARDARAREIIAVDSNPIAIELLRATCARHSYAQRIRPRLEPIEQFLSSRDSAEHVIFNLPHEGIKYLPSVATAVSPGGVLDFYEVVPREAVERQKETIMELTGSPEKWKVEASHVVHPYSPTADLVAFTLHRAAE